MATGVCGAEAVMSILVAEWRVMCGFWGVGNVCSRLEGFFV